jgi:hypothetical protein
VAVAFHSSTSLRKFAFSVFNSSAQTVEGTSTTVVFVQGVRGGERARERNKSKTKERSGEGGGGRIQWEGREREREEIK